MNAGIYREAGAVGGLPLPRKHLWPLTLAIGGLALVAIVMSPALLGFASGGSPAIAKVWRHVKEGGVFWMFLLLLCDVFASIAIGVLGAFIVRGKKIGAFTTFLAAALPLLLGAAGAYFGQSAALAAVAAVDPEVRSRIMAEGTAETLSNDLLAGFVACGCAIVACAASASSAASIDVAAASRDTKASRMGLVAASIVGGLWAIVTMVLVIVRVRATGPLVVFEFIAVLAIVPFAAMAGRGAGVLRAWHDRSEASRVLGGIVVAGLCAALGLLALERAAQASHVALALHAISGESVDPSQQARILMEAIAGQKYGALAMVLHAVFGIATFGAACVGSIGGGPNGTRHPMTASTLVAVGLALVCLLATGGLARSRTNVARMLAASGDGAPSGVSLPTLRGDFSRRRGASYAPDQVVFAADGTARGGVDRSDSLGLRMCAARYTVFADRAARVERLAQWYLAHRCQETRLAFAARLEHDPALDARLGDYRGFLGSRAWVTTQVSELPIAETTVKVTVLDDAIEIQSKRYPFPIPEGTRFDAAPNMTALQFMLRPTDTVAHVLAVVTNVRETYGWQIDDRVETLLDLALPPLPVVNTEGAFGTGKTSGKAPTVRVGTAQVNGRLPPEVIQRIVRANFGRFRLCYENALRKNPELAGRVIVKLVIDRSGNVSTAQDGGSDLADPTMVSCVVRAFGNLSFPQPEGGIVTVVYPLVFAPAEKDAKPGAEKP